jgi:predicted methyltransferase
MRRSVPYFAACAVLLPHLFLSANADKPNAAAIHAALSDPRRPTQQVELDPARKPAQLIAFAGLKAGDAVADFMPGNGYFTRIFSRVVGATGHVYAFLPNEQLANCAPREVAGTKALERDPRYENITVLSGAAAKFATPRKLDLIWTAQNYHDLHDSFMGPADTAVLNKAFFEALRPGGIYLVIDHVAQSGSGLRDTEALHRIDPAQLRREIESAGFVFEAQSAALRNPEDDHTLSVFDPRIRGRTDQVVYRFRKPGRRIS